MSTTTFSDLLSVRDVVFLTRIADLGDQKLRARLRIGGHEQLPRRIVDRKVEELLAEPLEYTSARYIDLTWARYLRFSVTDESLAPIRKGEEYTGRFIRLYSRSWLLSQLDELFNGAHTAGTPLHFCLACQDHVVDVLAFDEPAVADLGSQPISFGESLPAVF